MQIPALHVFPIPALQCVPGGVAKLPDGPVEALAKLDVQLYRPNLFFVGIN